MYKYFIEFIDYFEKFFKRFKIIGYFIIIGFVMFYFIENGFEKKRAIEVAEKLTGLNIEKDLLIGEKLNISNERDSILKENKILRFEKDSILKLKEQEAWKASKYKRERNEARKALVEYTPNENYDFLNTEAYPFIGKKEYDFNAKQIFGMRKTFVENEFNKNIIESQVAEIDYCNDALAKVKKLEESSDEIEKSYKEELSIYDDIIIIDEEIIDTTTKQWKKERLKRVWGKIERWVFFIGGIYLGTTIK